MWRPRWGYVGPVHDENYKKLFAFPRMVEDLVRIVVPAGLLDEFDFSTLATVPSEYVSEDLRTRRGDAVWRVRLRGGWLHVLVLLEFQSTDDPDMALRILEYTVLLYRELGRNDALGVDGKRPPVLPVVLYNGERRWKAPVDVGELIAPVGSALAPYQPSQRYLVLDERHVARDDLSEDNLMAAVVGLEQSRSPADLARVAEVLWERLRDPRHNDLERAFVGWDAVSGRAVCARRGGRPVPGRGHIGGCEDDAGRTRGTVAEAVVSGGSRRRPRGGPRGRSRA